MPHQLNFAKITRKLAILCLAFWLLPSSVVAKPTTPDQARRVVQGWLARDGRPLGTIMGRQVTEVQSFQDEQKRIVYFVVSLAPGGFVVVPADDLVEPIIAFVPQGQYNPALDNPLGILVSKDVPRRVAGVRKAEARAQVEGVPFLPQRSQEKACNKWQSLQSQGVESGLLENQGQESGLPMVSDPRVDPLVASKWSQDTVGNPPANCYNYYTPNHDPCGCVATATAQIMRYFRFPTVGVGTASFPITVEGVPRQEPLRGGDGKGGAYDWANMVLVPDSSTTDLQLQAIGALAHDAGVAMKMEYTSAESAANTSDACLALVNTFKYTNAILGASKTGIPATSLIPMLNPNLDASLPVQLGLIKTGVEGGHDVVADGYGYNLSTLYHHLNMGWSGSWDAWYNLPNVDLPSPDNYDTVPECIYNIYSSGAGEIISGRVLDGQGKPISSVTVQAVKSGGLTYTATTNSRGIYALARVPSASTYTIKVSKAGYWFKPQVATTGTSTSGAETTGNLWGVNFTGATKRCLSGIYELLLLD